ncbi:uncharacterized protein EI90DRAFT_3015066 [Cantharellus anzutake]|uniref:uncharacterized protein n=1 Tax=Cantharellus anzutake TaxID=1750568 RepID=UPI001908D9DE|nr:uncharacterized protein EI90DRAFT_3015066 [Cantharellus anzutake]KAF8333988.1 hypothetical protein EI90DRAFT_3015066 [Cantharellus anzutake]
MQLHDDTVVAISSEFAVFLRSLAIASESGNISTFIDLFQPNGYLRDILICAWNYSSVAKEHMREFFDVCGGLPNIKPASIKIDGTKTSPVKYKSQFGGIEGFFVFETGNNELSGVGVARLQWDNVTRRFRALTLSLVLDSFKRYVELSGARRPIVTPASERRAKLNWHERRMLESSFTSPSPKPNPDVVIVGAGHAGLMIAARLKRLGIVSLIIEKSSRVGDGWRNRYHSLKLQDTIWINQFPYLPFPDDFPVYLPKDKFADWIEIYATAMDLNVWLNSSVVPGTAAYDKASENWTLEIQRADDSKREIKCKHVILATGHASDPRIPHFEGVEKFKGPVHHSSLHKNSGNWKGKKAVIIGAGVSGHDICHELHNAGVEDITMVQRSSTCVISQENGLPQVVSGYFEGGPPAEEVDLASISFPFNALEPFAKVGHAAVNEADKAMIDGLERVGYRVADKGGPGLYWSFLRKGGGTYLDVGCAQLITDGKVKVKQGTEIGSFEENGVRCVDGSFLEADIVILATGYLSIRETCRKIFGDEVADQTDRVWGLDATGEVNGIWRQTGCPGFWYTGGTILLSRIHSKYLALWIKAIEMGLAPKSKV